jgi:cell division topological specificity factor
MNIFTLLGRKSSAPVARERLQILLSHERTTNCNADLIALLQQEVLAGLAKHIDIDPSQVQIKMKRREDVSLLEIDVEIPTPKVGRTPASPTPDATMPPTGRAGQAA